jgi:hypothetical protein
MRNRTINACSDIGGDVLRETAAEKVPSLWSLLRPALPK